MADTPISFSIGAGDQITAVSAEWDEFAARNDGPDGASVVGRVLWSFMEGPGVVDLWRRLVARARRGAEVEAIIRCDAPALQRTLLVTARSGGPGIVTFTTRVLAQAERSEIRLLGSHAPRTEEAVRICAWCHAIAIESAWVPLEDGVRALGLMDAVAFPRLTHGICEPCLQGATAA